jgi:hypothetical protein
MKSRLGSVEVLRKWVRATEEGEETEMKEGLPALDWWTKMIEGSLAQEVGVPIELVGWWVESDLGK